MHRVPKVLATVLFAAVLLIAFAGCSSGGAPLEETRWRLVGWTASSLDPAEFTITAAFGAGRVSGNSGVNTYSGPYKTGPGSALEVRELAGTLMAGPEPAMRAESIYLTLLEEARSFDVTDGRLTLHDEDGNESLIFEAMGE